MEKKDKSLVICKILIAILAVVLVVCFVMLIKAPNNKEAAKIERNEGGQVVVKRDSFNHINYDGSFVVRKAEGKDFEVVKDFSENKDKVIRQFEWYQDPLCPDCKRAYNGTNEYVKEAVKNGDIEIKYHILNFLPHATENNYSLSVSSWLIGIAEEMPENLYKALDIVEKEEFVKEIVSRTDISKEVYNKFIELKLADKEALDKIYYNLERYENAVNRGSVGIRKFKKWKDISGKEDGTFYVPFIYNINNGTKALLGESEDVEKEILQPLQGYVPCNEPCN